MKTKSHSISGAFVFTLLGAFAVFSMLLVVLGAQAFEPTLEGDLLTVRVTDETGHVSTVYIARRCAQ